MMTDKDMAVAAASVRSESPTTWKSRLKQAARAYTVPTSPLRPLPEFLIIGAQRTGTTSLYKYLSEHPQFRSATLKTKGVHFFDTRYDKGMAWYRAHFPTTAFRALFKARHGADLVTGEASPYYLFHPHVPYRLHQHLPNVKLIAMLRDPIERTYSQWQHELSRGFEHLDPSRTALDAEAGRLAGEVEKMNADPDYKSYSHQHHSYMARSRYADQIEVYFVAVPGRSRSTSSGRRTSSPTPVSSTPRSSSSSACRATPGRLQEAQRLQAHRRWLPRPASASRSTSPTPTPGWRSCWGRSFTWAD